MVNFYLLCNIQHMSKLEKSKVYEKLWVSQCLSLEVKLVHGHLNFMLKSFTDSYLEVRKSWLTELALELACTCPSLGKPVKVWSGIKNPTGIATNSMGEIIVTCEGDIIKFDIEGKEFVLVRHSETKLAQLRSITTDDEDNIYCIDFETNKMKST